MLYQAERELLVESVKELERTGSLDVGGGAAAVRTDTGDVVLTPTGLSFRRWEIAAEDLVIADLDGHVIERGSRLGAAPTPLFLSIFRDFPEVHAIIHGHPEWSLVFAAAGREIPA